MDVDQGSLQLKRPITIKSVVTPQWKEQAQAELQTQVSKIDRQMQSLETQGQQAIAQIQKQSVQPPSAEVQRQIENVQGQVNEQKNKMLNQKNQLLQQLNQIQGLELDQEVNQGQMDSFFTLKKGDNLVEKMQVEVLLRDGIVEEIRGQL
ncbi:MAG: YlqD family protein [Cyanobacteria bacterium P01_F01_bin.153]